MLSDNDIDNVFIDFSATGPQQHNTYQYYNVMVWLVHNITAVPNQNPVTQFWRENFFCSIRIC